MILAAATTGLLKHEYHHTHPGYFDVRALLRDGAPTRHERHRRASALLHAAQSAPVASNESAVINPIDYGADPTGEKGASDGLNAAVAALLALKREDRKDTLGLYDLGGATLDLSGGIYKLFEPVAIPVGYANFKVTRGTLVAGSPFPADAYMLSVGAGAKSCGAPPTAGLKAGNCNQDVDLSHLTVDAARIAYGGILVNHTMSVNIGPATMVVGFTGVGISLEGSGASFVHHAWLGAVAPGSPTPRPDATGTAIVLEDGQHDAMIEDVIIFAGRHGVRSANGANRLQGVHAWNLAGGQGGTGIELGVKWSGASGGRVQNCYLDYAPLVVTNPGNLVVTGNLFLGSSTLVLAARGANFAVRSVIIKDNEHHTGNSGNASFFVDERQGTFKSVTDVVVEGNEVDATDAAANKTSTRATKSAPLANGSSQVAIDFGPHLLFKRLPIDPPSIRCWLYGPHATAVSGSLATKASHTVIATLAEPVPRSVADDALITCTVDQSQRACPAH